MHDWLFVENPDNQKFCLSHRYIKKKTTSKIQYSHSEHTLYFKVNRIHWNKHVCMCDQFIDYFFFNLVWFHELYLELLWVKMWFCFTVARLRNHPGASVFTLNTGNRDAMRENIYTQLLNLLPKPWCSISPIFMFYENVLFISLIL